MKIQFNWGTGIFLFYTVFAGTLFYQVYKTTQYDHSLVMENYYEEDLKYQQIYDKKQNSLNLPNPVAIDLTEREDLINIQFPAMENEIKGTVQLYRPDDKSKDVHLPVTLNESGLMSIQTKPMIAGRWHVAVDWESGSDLYYDSDLILIKKKP